MGQEEVLAITYLLLGLRQSQLNLRTPGPTQWETYERVSGYTKCTSLQTYAGVSSHVIYFLHATEMTTVAQSSQSEEEREKNDYIDTFQVIGFKQTNK